MRKKFLLLLIFATTAISGCANTKERTSVVINEQTEKNIEVDCEEIKESIENENSLKLNEIKDDEKVEIKYENDAKEIESNINVVDEKTTTDICGEQDTNNDLQNIENETVNEFVYNVTDVERVGYVTTPLNIRKGPSTEYDIIGYFKFAEDVNITGECDNGWLRISYNNDVAYVSGKYVSDTKPEIKVQEIQVTNAVPGIGESRAGASQAWVNKLNAELAYVPENLKVHFVNSGWHIYITTENIAQTWFPGVYNSVQGMTSFDQKMIVIETRDVAVSGAVVHEFGHYFDYILSFPSQSSEFLEIYNEEVNTFKSQIPNSSSVRDTYEFFATIYEYIIKDPSKCTPRAMAFVQERINSF